MVKINIDTCDNQSREWSMYNYSITMGESTGFRKQKRINYDLYHILVMQFSITGQDAFYQF